MISTLNTMIEDNKKREEEIEKRKVEINKLESELATQVTSLGEKKSQLSSGGVSIAKQMQTIQDKINMYKKKGCKLDDVIGVDCDNPSSNGFRRPTTTGWTRRTGLGSMTSGRRSTTSRRTSSSTGDTTRSRTPSAGASGSPGTRRRTSMKELVKDFILVVAPFATALAGYLAGRYDGYAKAVKDHLDNLERQKTKNWYKRLYAKED